MRNIFIALIGILLFPQCEKIDEEKEIKEVTLADFEMILVEGSHEFYIAKYEVTQEQYKAVMGNNPSYCVKGEKFPEIGKNHPVERVSYNNSLEFIKKLNTKFSEKFRLPTADEWRFAATGGKWGKNYKYSGSNNLDEVAWFSGNTEDGTHPVGGKRPNELGIYDMTGNVCEWTSTDYPTTNDDTFKVYLGGSVNTLESECSPAITHGWVTDEPNGMVGIRLARDK